MTLGDNTKTRNLAQLWSLLVLKSIFCKFWSVLFFFNSLNSYGNKTQSALQSGLDSPGYWDLAKGIKLSQLFILTLSSYLKFQVLSLCGYTYAIYLEFLDSKKSNRVLSIKSDNEWNVCKICNTGIWLYFKYKILRKNQIGKRKQQLVS